MMNSNKSKLRGKTVLVTGGTGFIGGRLIEKLVLEQQPEVRVLIRDYSRAARIARFDSVKMVKASLKDWDAIDTAIDGCDIVFHCAYDPASQKNNLDGIVNLAEACIHAKARLVHVSTVSIYEPLPDYVLGENGLTNPKGFQYGVRKLEIEKKVMDLIRKQNLNAVIIQPTIVYGAFSAPWTMRPVNQLLNGTVVLPGNGDGLCNAVYVDDVCNAMILAGVVSHAKGERYLISGNTPITWREFFEAFQSVLGTDSIVFMPVSEIKKMMRNPFKLLKTILGDPKKAVDWEPLKSFLISIRYKIPSSTRTWIKKVYGTYSKYSPKPVYFPNSQMIDLFKAYCTVDIGKAKKELGYIPQYNFKTGMKKTSEFIDWAFPKDLNV